MMTIKFRAWDVKGEYFKPLEDDGDYYFRDDGDGLTLYDKWGSCKDVVLMQFTGLHDKNGVEIYEGDIMKNDLPYENTKDVYPFYKVEWEINTAGFVLRELTGPKFTLRFNWHECASVIGNIYQHPNLIT